MDIAEEVGLLLKKNKLNLAIAESCTGGLVGDLITNISGSSDYFLGGIIAYDNRIKIEVLGVKRETIDLYGAVSEETAKEMASCVREKFGSDIAVSITGVAGPTGGSEEKPIGLTYIGLATRDTVIAKKFLWKGNRIENKEQSAKAALEIIREYLEV
ncbi:MAG TPA: CinA family protein [Candidatus Saccharimonadales bacterium]|nr:CinA family protein [Candidatus Saccharimonadales bacterium]